MFKNLKLRMKLFLSLGLIVLMMMGLALYSYFSHSRLDNSFNRMANINFQTLGTVDDINLLRAEISRNLTEFVASTSSDYTNSLQRDMAKSIDNIRTRMEALQSTSTDSEIVQPLLDLKTAFDQWTIVFNNEVALKNAKKQTELSGYFNSTGKQAFASLTEKISNLVNVTKNEIDISLKEAQTIQKSTVIVSGILNGAAILLAIFLAFFLGENIVRPIHQIVKDLDKAGKGDLRAQGPRTRRGDEIGALVIAFDFFLEQLREQISEMSAMVVHMASSSSEMSATSAQLGSSASETAASVVQTASTTEEIRQVSQMTKELAGNVSTSADKTYELSKESLSDISQTAGNIEKTKSQMDNVTKSLMGLSEQSQMIGEIISAVDDIAEQSNLLAVNAAIEAAKAGEQGKGFSVVAQEVRSLADQSKQSTRQVRKILSDIQKATNTALMAAEQGNKEMSQSSEKMDKANTSMHAIADALAESTKLVQQIAYAVEQQFTGIDQINSAMNSVTTASSQNADAARNLEQVAAAIRDSGDKMRSFVEHYKF